MSEKSKIAIIYMVIIYKNQKDEPLRNEIELTAYYYDGTRIVDVFEADGTPYIFEQSTNAYDSIVDAVHDIALDIISDPSFECFKQFDVKYFHEMMASSHGEIRTRKDLLAVMLDDQEDYDLIDHEGED